MAKYANVEYIFLKYKIKKRKINKKKIIISIKIMIITILNN